MQHAMLREVKSHHWMWWLRRSSRLDAEVAELHLPAVPEADAVGIDVTQEGSSCNWRLDTTSRDDFDSW